MSSSKDTLTVVAGHLAEALRTILPLATGDGIGVSGVSLTLAAKNRLSVSRSGSRVLVPARDVSGFWFAPVTVNGHPLAFVGRLFLPTQPVEIVVERTEVVLRGAGFRLCIKRLESIAPRAAESRRIRTG